LDLQLSRGAQAVGSNLKKCYEMMISNGWIGKEEKVLVEAWVKDIESIKDAAVVD
jgi:hypothetical protein